MTDGYKYTVSKRSDLINIIIPHFDKYPLVGSKHLDFLDFKKCVLLMNKLDNDNRLSIIDDIIKIKSLMNTGRSYDDRWNYLNNKTFDLNPEWIQAFIDGEGTFQCRIADTVSRNSNYVAVNPTLEIAQNSYDVLVLNAIIKFFGIGYLKPKFDITSLEDSRNSRSVSRAIFNQSNIIINFIDKYPMLTNKNLDFFDWKTIIELKEQGTHKTIEGKDTMISIKKGMNRGRLLSSKLLPNSSKLTIINSNNQDENDHTSNKNKQRE